MHQTNNNLSLPNFCASWKHAIVSLTLLIAPAPDRKMCSLASFGGLQGIAKVCEGHLFILLQKVQCHDPKAIAIASTCIAREGAFFFASITTAPHPSTPQKVHIIKFKDLFFTT